MKSVRIIALKELASYFDSLMAYILLVLFLGFSGFFTWLFGSDIFLIGQASLINFFKWSYWTLFFFIPGITMRSLAEEQNSGTYELIATKSVSDWQIVLGKFFAAWTLVIFALLFTLPYYYSVSRLGNIDHGAVLGGYLGLALISASYIGIGIFASAISRNQIIAFLLSLSIAFFFQFIFELISLNMTGFTAIILSFLSLNNHFQSLARGVIDSRDIFFFASLTFTGLLGAHYMLSKRLFKGN